MARSSVPTTRSITARSRPARHDQLVVKLSSVANVEMTRKDCSAEELYHYSYRKLKAEDCKGWHPKSLEKHPSLL